MSSYEGKKIDMASASAAKELEPEKVQRDVESQVAAEGDEDKGGEVRLSLEVTPEIAASLALMPMQQEVDNQKDDADEMVKAKAKAKAVVAAEGSPANSSSTGHQKQCEEDLIAKGRYRHSASGSGDCDDQKPAATTVQPGAYCQAPGVKTERRDSLHYAAVDGHLDSTATAHPSTTAAAATTTTSATSSSDNTSCGGDGGSGNITLQAEGMRESALRLMEERKCILNSLTGVLDDSKQQEHQQHGKQEGEGGEGKGDVKDETSIQPPSEGSGDTTSTQTRSLGGDSTTNTTTSDINTKKQEASVRSNLSHTDSMPGFYQFRASTMSDSNKSETNSKLFTTTTTASTNNMQQLNSSDTTPTTTTSSGTTTTTTGGGGGLLTDAQLREISYSKLPIAAKLVVEETESEIFKRISEMYLEGSLPGSSHGTSSSHYSRHSRRSSHHSYYSHHSNLPMAELVVTTNSENGPFHGGKKWMMLSLIAILLLLGILIGVVVGLTTSNSSSSHKPNNATFINSTLLPVLDTIKKNDKIRCRAETVEVNKGEGFTIDLCRALAAAVLGDASKVAFLKIPFRDQFRAISMGEVDVSTTLNTLNMERDVYHLDSRYGYTFSDPYFYSGTTFAGIPEFVDCVDRGESFEGICRQLMICVISNTVTKDLVNQHFPGSATKLVKDGKDLLQTFVDGRCNVMAEAAIAIYEQRARDLNYTGEYAFAKSGSWTFEPFAMITRQSDPQWSDFSNWVLRSLIAAESLNITDENASTFPQTEVFGDEYEDMFRLALGAVGNYGQMYERHFQDRVPRQGMNLLHRGESTGLLVANPLGDILIDESLHQINPTPNGTLEAVIRRGHLRCGLSEERAGFAEFDPDSGTWFGLDVEYCKGISASIFAGRADTIVYEFLDSAGSNQFGGLADGRADVLAGGTVLLRSDVNEPMTGRGYTFSPPYFFEEKGARRAMVTREDDQQWSDLVRWVSQAPIYAEGEGITQWNASLMPIIELFSTDLRQMLRDTIGTIGNYEEIYNRTMEHHIPRYGWNHLNSGNDPQLLPFSFTD